MPRRPYEHPLKSEVRTAGALFTGILAALWACALWGGPTWMFEVGGNFAVPVALCGALLAGALLWARGWTWFGAALAVTLWSASLPLGWLSEGPPSSTAVASMGAGLAAPAGSELGGSDRSSGTLRFAVLNVLSSNATQGRVVEQVLAEDPDVVLILETTTAWQTALDQLAVDRPYVVSKPRGDNFGIALLSKHPFNRSRLVDINMDLGPTLPAVQAELLTPLGQLTLIGVHTFPPVSDEAWEQRETHLLRTAELARVTEGPVVVMGDLNTSMSTRSYRLLSTASQLRNARQGRGWMGTWPAGAPSWLRIPLDHILHDEEVVIHDLRVLEPNGSDHLGLVADLSLAPEVIQPTLSGTPESP